MIAPHPHGVVASFWVKWWRRFLNDGPPQRHGSRCAHRTLWRSWIPTGAQPSRPPKLPAGKDSDSFSDQFHVCFLIWFYLFCFTVCQRIVMLSGDLAAPGVANGSFRFNNLTGIEGALAPETPECPGQFSPGRKTKGPISWSQAGLRYKSFGWRVANPFLVK